MPSKYSLRRRRHAIDTAITVASINDAISRHDEAITMGEEYVGISTRVNGRNARTTIIGMDNLACAYQRKGMVTKALPLLEEVVLLRKALNPGDPYLFTVRKTLVSLYSGMGAFDKALQHAKDAYEAAKKALDPDHHDNINLLSQLASVYQGMGRHGDAAALYEQALELCKGTKGSGSINTTVLLRNLGRAYLRAGRAFDAIPCYREVVMVRKTVLGLPTSSLLEQWRSWQTSTLRTTCVQRGSLAFQGGRGEGSQENPMTKDIVNAMNVLAGLCRRMGKYERALELCLEILPLLAELFGHESEVFMRTKAWQASVLASLDWLDEAIALLNEALERKVKEKTPHPEVIVIYFDLAAVYYSAGRVEDVHACKRAAVKFTKKLMKYRMVFDTRCNCVTTTVWIGVTIV